MKTLEIESVRFPSWWTDVKRTDDVIVVECFGVRVEIDRRGTWTDDGTRYEVEISEKKSGKLLFQGEFIYGYGWVFHRVPDIRLIYYFPGGLQLTLRPDTHIDLYKKGVRITVFQESVTVGFVEVET